MSSLTSAWLSSSYTYSTGSSAVRIRISARWSFIRQAERGVEGVEWDGGGGGGLGRGGGGGDEEGGGWGLEQLFETGWHHGGKIEAGDGARSASLVENADDHALPGVARDDGDAQVDGDLAP